MKCWSPTQNRLCSNSCPVLLNQASSSCLLCVAMLVDPIEELCWEGFSFRRLSISDLPLVQPHLIKYFLEEEPVHMAFQENETEETLQFDKHTFRVLLEMGLSFMVLHKESGQVAGVLMMAEYWKGVESGFVLPPPTNAAQTFFTQIDLDYDVFEEEDVERYAELYLCTIHPAYRAQGLATHMTRLALSLLKSSGHTVVKSVATSPFSHRLFAGLGFRQARTWSIPQLPSASAPTQSPSPQPSGKVILEMLRF